MIYLAVLRNRHRLAIVAAAAGAVAGTATWASAANGVWSGGGSGTWADPTDWVGGIVPGVPSTAGSGDIALFNGSGGSHTTVAVDANRSVGAITFDSAAVAAYTLAGGNLLLADGGPVQMTATVTSPQLVSSNLVAVGPDGGSVSLVNNATSAAATLTVSGTVIPSSPSSYGSYPYFGYTTLYLGGTNTGANAVTGTLHDYTSGNEELLSVAKVGSGTWTLAGSTAYGGTTTVYAGTLHATGTFGPGQTSLATNYSRPGAVDVIHGTLDLPDTTLGPASSLVLNVFATDGTIALTGRTAAAPTTGLAIYDGGTVSIDNTGMLVSGRLNGASFSLGGGQFTYVGGAGNSSETLNQLIIAEGANGVTLTPNAVGSTIVSSSTIGSDAGGTLLVTGTHLGETPGPGVTNLVPTYSMASVGGNYQAAPGSVNLPVVAQTIGRDLALTGNAQYGFLSTGTAPVVINGPLSSAGFRLLDLSTEYAHSIDEAVDVGTAYRNVSLTSPSTVNNAGTTVNTLRLDTAGQVTGAGTLNIYTGCILALPGNAGLNVATVNFGTRAGEITTVGDLSVGGNLTGMAGLVKTGPGTLSLAAATALPTGGLTLNQGTVRLAAANQLPGVGPVTLAGGSLDLNGFGQFIANLGGGAVAGATSSIGNAASSPYATVTIGGGESTVNRQPTPFLGTFGGGAGNNLGLTIDAGLSAQEAATNFNSDTVVSLSGASTYTGPTAVVSGTLNVDFSRPTSPTANVLPATTTLSVAAPVKFTVGALPATQAIATTVVQPGATAITQTTLSAGLSGGFEYPATASYGGSLQVNLGAVSHATGGTLGLYTLAAGANGGTVASGFATTSANVNGILGGYLTLNGTDWAAANASGGIVAPTYTTNAWSAGANVTVTAATANQSAGATANSLRFAAAGADTVNLAGTGTLASGGVLVSSAVGAHLSKVAGGTLLPGSGHEAFLNQWNTAANLEVDSVVADAAANAPTVVTVGGTGTVVLGGANTYTGGTYLGGTATLDIAANNNLGLSSAGGLISMAGGTLTATQSVTLSDGSHPRPVVAGPMGGTLSGPLVVSGPISGGADAILAVAGVTLTAVSPFTGVIEAYPGPTTLANAAALSHATLGIESLNAGGSTQPIQFAPGIGSFTVAGLTNLNPDYSAWVLTVADTAGNPVTLIVGNDNQSSTYNGGLNGTGSLTKIGTGTLTLGGTTSIAGRTLVSAGTLRITSASGLSTPPSYLDAYGGPVENDASLVFAIGGVGSTTISTGPITGNGTTTVTAGTLRPEQLSQAGGLVDVSYVQTVGNATVSQLGRITGSGTLIVGGTSAGQANTVRLTAGDGLSTLGALTVNAGSVFDLTDNAVDVSAGNLSMLTTLAATGFAGGTWAGGGTNGSGGAIVSTTAAADARHLTAVGVIQNATTIGGTVPIYTSYDGQPVSATDILIRYTYYGDANLDGVVNAADYTRIDAGYLMHLTGWQNGDFNYDGVVDGSDYSLMDNAFNQQAGGIGTPAAALAEPAAVSDGPRTTSVPEPAAGGIVAIGLMTMRRSRRRRIRWSMDRP